MKAGKIEAEETGLTNGHPAIIISGKMKTGTVCKVNGLLMLDAATGAFEAHTSGAACIALEPITASTENAAVLLHGTFNRDAVVKANGTALTAAELAAVQKASQIFFV